MEVRLGSGRLPDLINIFIITSLQALLVVTPVIRWNTSRQKGKNRIYITRK
jgi:hypothetical protein